MAAGRIPTTANSPITAKGDLFTYSTAPARLAVGNDGEQIVADSSTSTGLRYQGNYAAGKNAVINGAFDNWQRGTSISLTTGTNAYGADRFINSCTFSAGSATVSRQTFTPGTAPVAGYEGQYFSRLTCGSTTTVWAVRQRIENVQSFAGQTVTLSFWVKASAANATTAIQFAQNFGSGGSASVNTDLTGPSITTSWQRFSVTAAIPSISGKTIGTSSYLEFTIYSTTSIASSLAVDLWGVQVEAGSVATAFQTATGTIQGELSAAMRYYYRVDSANANDTRMNTANMVANSTTVAYGNFAFPVRMRTSPTFSSSTATGWSLGRINAALTALGQERSSQYSSMVKATVASGLTAGNGDWLEVGNNNTAYIEFSAEL